MIHKLQGQISTLTQQVNKLTEQAANESLYRTVDETNPDPTTRSHDDPAQPLIWAVNGDTNNMRKHVMEQEIVCVSNTEDHDSPIRINIDDLPSPNIHIPDFQTRTYSEAVRRTSTPRTPQRVRPASSHAQSRQNSDPQRETTMHNAEKQILLIGDSLISHINPRGLKQNVHKSGISGGNIHKVTNQLKVFDLKQFTDIIIYVGGNDAASKSDPELFEVKYDQLIQHIKDVNDQCQIFLCNSCPRGDCSTSEVNDLIKSLAEEYQITMIDVNKSFCDSRKKIIDRYYSKDCIHLSNSGVKRLLGTINTEISVVHDFDKCIFNGHQQRKYNPNRAHDQQSRPGSRRTFQDRHRYSQDRHKSSGQQGTVMLCYKCGESNHDTNNCKHTEQLTCHHCGYRGHKSWRCLHQ